MKIQYFFAFFVVIGSVICSSAYAKNTTFVGKPAPTFKGQAMFPDGSIRELDLKDYKGDNVVVYFYPMNNSSSCTIQAKKFRDEMKKLSEKDIYVIGISTDTIDSHKKFSEKLALPFPLVSDSKYKNAISKKYEATGVLFGKRKTFLINKKGIVFKVFDTVDIKNQVDDIVKSYAQEK